MVETAIYTQNVCKNDWQLKIGEGGGGRVGIKMSSVEKKIEELTIKGGVGTIIRDLRVIQ